MATQSSIFEVRKTILDPLGFIDIISIQNADSFPSEFNAQTLYYLEDIKEYQSYKRGKWQRENLYISDDRIGSYIDSVGIEKAEVKALESIVYNIGSQIGVLAKSGSGSETVEYIDLSKLYGFYKSIIKDMKEEIAETAQTSTGRFFGSCGSVVGGIYEA